MRFSHSLALLASVTWVAGCASTPRPWLHGRHSIEKGLTVTEVTNTGRLFFSREGLGVSHYDQGIRGAGESALVPSWPHEEGRIRSEWHSVAGIWTLYPTCGENLDPAELGERSLQFRLGIYEYPEEQVVIDWFLARDGGHPTTDEGHEWEQCVLEDLERRFLALWNLKPDREERALERYQENIARELVACFEAPPGASEDLVAMVRLVVQPDGTATDVEIVRGSGHAAFDQVALDAVRNCAGDGRFGPLPVGFDGETLPVRFEFRAQHEGVRSS